jgi:hypothetical protein
VRRRIPDFDLGATALLRIDTPANEQFTRVVAECEHSHASGAPRDEAVEFRTVLNRG